MRSFPRLFAAAAVAVLPAAAALADFDVSPYVQNGKILTGGYEDDTGTFVSNVRVLDFGFDQTPSDTGNNTYFTQDPGFHPQAHASGFGPGDALTVTPVSGLSYYSGDGTGPISFTPVTGGTTLSYSFGSQGPAVIGADSYSGSISFPNLDANGEQDRHLEATLAGGSGSVAPDGLYLLELQVSDPNSNYAASAPAYILYSVNDDDAVDPAKEYLRDTYAPGTNLTPEPASLGGLALGGVALLRRRRPAA